jgi:EAL and modified HD-GYP domain-containing signal transduction protein
MGVENTHGEVNLHHDQIFVARQPVFKTDLSIWGYELLFRDNPEARTAQFQNPEIATSQVISDGFSIARASMSHRAKTLINFSERLILDEAPYALPDGEVVELLEEVQPSEEILKKCRELKKHFLLAVDDYTGASLYRPLIDLADIVKVDVLNMDPDNIRAVVQQLRDFKGLLLAEKVEDYAMFELTRTMGFELFQGFFFSHPVTISGKKLASNEISKLRLMHELERTHFDPQTFTEIIQSDVAISYRLLSFINSPGVGLLCEVRSIKHAIKLLGEKRVRQWLRILIMADVAPTKKGMELVQLSVTRAYFLRSLAERYETPVEEDSMFLIGLLSLLDVILNQRMSELLQYIALDTDLADTLLGTETEARSWLELAIACEKGHWDAVGEYVRRLGVDNQEVASAYNKALMHAYKLLSNTV